MKLIFTPVAQEHWNYWKKNDPNIAKRIKKLLADILEHPYSGIGKPEPLKYELAGKWRLAHPLSGMVGGVSYCRTTFI